MNSNPGPASARSRATHWRLRTTTLRFGQRPLIMGIVNVTPDSFSDGGRFLKPTDAIAYALELVRQGADILDIGGESTRPYSRPVDEDQELRRVEHVVERLAQIADRPISIDTSKARVARAAVERGAQIINDVSGMRDREMVSVAVQSGAGVCVMHMQGTPQTMQDRPRYDDVVAEVSKFLGQRRRELIEAGIAADRICLDPGLGFGKTTQHNLDLLRNCHQLHNWEAPLLVGHSRKGFLGKLIDDMDADRGAAGIGAALALARQGVQILRVHDVAATRQALAAFKSGGGLDHGLGFPLTD